MQGGGSSSRRWGRLACGTPGNYVNGANIAGLHNLMPFRVQDLLMVSSLYELFILEEDGLLNELITSEYIGKVAGAMAGP